MDMESYVKGCFLEPRKGETISLIPAVKLEGYAIIPIEKYEDLVEDYSSRKASSFDQVWIWPQAGHPNSLFWSVADSKDVLSMAIPVETGFPLTGHLIIMLATTTSQAIEVIVDTLCI